MKLSYLANASCIHTTKWLNHFCRKGHDVEVFSFEKGIGLDPGVALHIVGRRLPLATQYLFYGSEVRRMLKISKPDIVHAHYASGYGSLGRLANFHPYVLSVWGSDIFEFPKRSPIHRELLRKNLRSANRVCSTSYFMARETERLCSQTVVVTPFGVDCDQFRPHQLPSNESDEFVIGTVKSLEPKYGIEYLIRSFALLVKRHRKERKLRLVIAGDGSLRGSLPELAKDLGVHGQTEFLGKVPHDRVPQVLNTFSVFAALSVDDSETFGVAVVEASACEIPVVVTSVGGLPEVVNDRETGFIVPPRDIMRSTKAFETLMENMPLRRCLGAAGRKFVLQKYEWSENASRMERVYESLLRAG